MRLKSYFGSDRGSGPGPGATGTWAGRHVGGFPPYGLDTRHLGDYEVVCAAVRPEPAAARADRSFDQRLPRFAGAQLGPPLSGRVGFEAPHGRMADNHCPFQRGLSNLRSNPELSRKRFRLLTAAEVDRSWPTTSLRRMAERLRRDESRARAVREEIGNVLKVDPSLGRAPRARPSSLWSGRPGAGKTTCLVKLAARYGLATRKPTQILKPRYLSGRRRGAIAILCRDSWASGSRSWKPPPLWPRRSKSTGRRI